MCHLLLATYAHGIACYSRATHAPTAHWPPASRLPPPASHLPAPLTGLPPPPPAAIVADAARRSVLEGDAAACGAALRGAVAALLVAGAGAEAQPPSEEAGALLRYLDERLCVPRDLGAPSAAAIRALAQPAES